MKAKLSPVLRVALALLALVPVASRADDGLAIRALDANTTIIDDGFQAQAVQADGKLLAVSSTADGLLSLRRYLPSGALDAGFDAGALQPRGFDSLTPLPSGQLLVLGRFGPDPNAGVNVNNDVAVSAGDDDDDDDDDDVGGGNVEPPVFAPDPEQLLRLNADGARDAAFQPAPLVFDWAQTVKPLADGRTLIGGYVTPPPTADGVYPPSIYNLVRLGADGRVDGSFQPVFPAGDYITDVQVQTDGRILVASSGGGLFRLKADGSRDAAFQPTLPAGSEVDAFTVLSDGAVLVATSPIPTGNEDEDAVEISALTRINPTSSVDPAFAATLAGSVNALHALANGAALAEGDFTGADGVERYGLLRVEADGRVSVAYASSDNEDVSDVAVLADGSLIVGLTTTDADGNRTAALAAFDAAGAGPVRQTIAADRSLISLTARPGGGLYVNVTSMIFQAPLGVTFAPPPAPGSSVVRGKATISAGIGRGEAYAGSRRMAKFVLTRTGDLSRDIRVVYEVKGTAVSGRDYFPLRGKRLMRAGRSSVRIKVRPMGPRYGRVREGGASVKLTLIAKHAYAVGELASAKVRLLNHRQRSSRP